VSADVISILIPTYNEERYIADCLRSVLEFRIPDIEEIEIFVLDGMSTDRTREVVRAFRARDARIQLVENPGRIQSCALNLGILRARGAWILRLDAHARYPEDYLARCFEIAMRTGAENVGGICITQPGGDGYGAQVVQALTTHRFGVGNSGFRTRASAGFRDTVPFGFFRRDVFQRIGLFDERLVRTQDYEFNRRLAKAGGRVYLDPSIQSSYFNLGSLRALLAKQLRAQGPYCAYMWNIAPYAFAPRHAVTAVFAAAVWVGTALAICWPTLMLPFGAVLAAYASLAVVAAVQQAVRFRDVRHVVALPFAFFLFHLCHGTGVLAGLARVATGTAPTRVKSEPWPGAGKLRPWA
jgi:succinoglycan biosynthesis protein ExoA